MDEHRRLLAEAVFTNEGATGWQRVSFSPPVAIDANTTYVASYLTKSGNYAATPNYFATSGHVRPPLEALADNVAGANGVFSTDRRSWRIPDPHLRHRELLGRRGVQDDAVGQRAGRNG